MKIISGRLKGRSIPIPPRSGGDIQTTPQKVKKAVFSILGDDLSGLTFLDLFSCSGQMAAEAFSRGAATTAVEVDGRKAAAIRDFSIEFCGGSLEVRPGDAFGAVRRWAAEGRTFDVIFIDPPYTGSTSGVPTNLAALEACAAILSSGGTAVVQHDFSQETPQVCGALRLDRRRDYGNTSISVYEFGDDCGPE